MTFSAQNLTIVLSLMTSFASLAQVDDTPLTIPPTDARIVYIDCGTATSPALSRYERAGFVIASVNIDGKFQPRQIFTVLLSDMDDLCQLAPIPYYLDRKVLIENYQSDLERRIIVQPEVTKK